MKLIKQTTIASILLLSSFITKAQITSLDTIFKVNNTLIVCDVIEMSTTEVRYTYPEKPNLVLAVSLELVKEVKLKTGETLKPSNDEEMLTVHYDNQKTMAIKLKPFSPINGFLGVGFEKSLKPGVSLEATLSIIGVGFDALSLFEGNRTVSGMGVTLGQRFYAKPDISLKGLKRAHRMSGTYIKPELAFMRFKETYDLYDYNSNSGQFIETFFISPQISYLPGSLISKELTP
jgi:hypothetical protein